MNATVRNEVLEVYAAVDAAVAQASPRCEASGRCCRFTEYGHTLFISNFEAELLLETAPHFHQPIGPEVCPFQVDGLCTARAERPLGCRIFFCDPKSDAWQSDITESAIRKLKDIAERHGTPWRYAPLHVFLNETRLHSAPVNSTTERIPLPLSQ